MRGRERSISFFIIVVLLIGGLVYGTLEDTKNRYYYFPDVPKPSTAKTTDLTDQAILVDEPVISSVTGNTNYSDKTLLVDDNFTSNLPLVIIDTHGQEPKIGSIWNEENEYYIPIEEDPYAYGEIFIIDNKNSTNSPNETATLYSQLKIKIRGNSSSNYDKKQYLLKLLDSSGNANNKNILEMGSDNEWILNISFIDKSLIRNFLAYTTVGQVMPYTPDARFCEVLWKEGDHYRYEGVYMMLESVKVSKDRVDLPQYSENSPITPTLLRRDRYNLNGIMLDNYATKNGLTPGFLDIEYPKQDIISENGIKNITKMVDRFEQALYAEDWETFVQYRDFINIESFVDYFIFNEFFLNYDAGHNSTYIYMDYSGKLTMGPIWDFDQAFDNNANESAILNTTAFHSAPWFDSMLQDPIFTDRIIIRYHQLRKSILSDKSISDFVHSIVDYLGSSINRDWARWGYYYTHGNYLQQEYLNQDNRNTSTHTEEVQKILNILSEHSAWMDDHIDSLYQFKKISLEEAQAEMITNIKDYGNLFAIIFIGLFLISIKLVIRYENE